MIKFHGRVALAALAASVAATTASAAVVTATYQGKVTTGYDQTGKFGVAGRDLGGLNFKVVFFTNTEANAIVYDDAASSFIFGGESYGNEDPTSAILTIGDQSIRIGLGWEGSASEYDNGNTESISHVSSQISRITYNSDTEFVHRFYQVYVNVMANGADFLDGGVNFRRATGSYTLGENDYGLGRFDNFRGTNDLFETTAPGDFKDYANLKIESVTFGAMAAVPEPGTWALALVGFGFAGSAIRKRRSSINAV